MRCCGLSGVWFPTHYPWAGWEEAPFSFVSLSADELELARHRVGPRDLLDRSDTEASVVDSQRRQSRATGDRAASMRAHGTRLLACLFAAILALGVAAGASLADTIATSAPTSTTVDAGAAATIPGASVADSPNPGQTLLVTVSTSLGTLSMSQTTGLALTYGYSSFSGSSISFTGSGADANAALASLALTGSGTPGTAAVSVTATVNQNGIAYLPSNGHYYEYVASLGTSWTAAQTAANAATFEGQEGYLASVPSQTVKGLCRLHLNGAQNVWAGGSSVDYPTGNGPDGSQRAWSWFGQPTPGQTNTAACWPAPCSPSAATSALPARS